MKTPLHRLTGDRRIFVKLEMFCPTGSGKFRVAQALCRDALKRSPDIGGLVDATSGRTGGAIAHFARQAGKSTVMIMPRSLRERAAFVVAEGGRVVLVDGGMKEAREAARQFADTYRNYFYTDQFSSPLNVDVHRRVTAAEIAAQLPEEYRKVWVVSGCGTGGTLAGVTLGLRERGRQTECVCAVPITATGEFSSLIPGVADRASQFVDWHSMDSILISEQEALSEMRNMRAVLGMMCGPSSGLNIAAAMRVADRCKDGECVVTFFPDGSDGAKSEPHHIAHQAEQSHGIPLTTHVRALEASEA